MKRSRFLRALLGKRSKLGSEDYPSDYCWWAHWSCFHEKVQIPRDVPKGHLVVYVGDEHKRFVIRATFLSHPLFRALLDRAQEEYEFSPDSKLCIPCDEKIFLGVVRCVNTQQGHRIWVCS